MSRENMRPQIETELLAGNLEYKSKADSNAPGILSVTGQKPKAIVISCSDSRVPVEIIFNKLEPGLLYTVRVAGNIICDPAVIGSIEFGILCLKIPSIVLLGHTDCGAVKARIENCFASENIKELCKLIVCKSKVPEQAVVENIAYQFSKLLEINCVKDGIENGKLTVCSMIYNLANGTVSVLEGNEFPAI